MSVIKEFEWKIATAAQPKHVTHAAPAAILT